MATAVQKVWQAKQPMKWVNARQASELRVSCWSSRRRASTSSSRSGTGAAWGEPRAPSSFHFVRLLTSQFRRAIRWPRGAARSDKRYWSSAAGSEPNRALVGAQTASVQTRTDST
jgi:hypothetical protein